MTNQEIYNKVSAHLLAQGTQAKSADGGCMLRTNSGKRCAVGCLISEENYDPALELDSEIGVQDPKLMKVLEKEIGHELQDSTISLLVCLQSIHDNKQPENWRLHLTELAGSFNLEPIQ